jgi:hypothetical protein
MSTRLRNHLRNNVVGYIALFVALSGTAYALDGPLAGQNTVGSEDIINDEVRSADVRNDGLADGGLTSADLRARSVGTSEIEDDGIRSADVRNDGLPDGGLTGADIRNQSGVDNCTHNTVRLGELCFRAANAGQVGWYQALGACSGLGLRLPSLSEAAMLANAYDLPGVDDQELFWTSEYWDSGNDSRSMGISDGGGSLDSSTLSTYEVVCVTTPTN